MSGIHTKIVQNTHLDSHKTKHNRQITKGGVKSYQVFENAYWVLAY